ncbi:RadC family protein [Acidovorax sp. NCPPB 4044]|uniref:RadC family protein n=1 Tax=Acidovorax sp. NCPPB 4044 TaxID=2940490 RepID=UPI0023030448|nr:DNA repair protein RadC [Acidovorax sp. NCPPB 4044]MDA8520385.1 DNA repair protein RadC [Acidovorax sp. NCPPB 4044]
MEQPTPEVLASTSAPAFSVQERRLIYRAIEVLERKLFQREAHIPSPEALFDYLRLKLAREPNELFGAVFLDNKHQVIAFEALAIGTINQAIVHPRVVVKRAMELNAAAVILAHNHPSGDTQDSAADRMLTERLQSALGFVDIRVLDHVIVGKGTPYSFAQAGLL